MAHSNRPKAVPYGKPERIPGRFFGRPGNRSGILPTLRSPVSGIVLGVGTFLELGPQDLQHLRVPW